MLLWGVWRHVLQPPHRELSPQVMVTNVKSLLETVKTVEDEAARGTRALESSIDAIGHEIRVSGVVPRLKQGSPFCLSIRSLSGSFVHRSSPCFRLPKAEVQRLILQNCAFFPNCRSELRSALFCASEHHQYTRSWQIIQLLSPESKILRQRALSQVIEI